MIKAPAIMAAAPTPEIALPTMKAAELGATAEISEPISKIASAPVNVHFAEYRE